MAGLNRQRGLINEALTLRLIGCHSYLLLLTRISGNVVEGQLKHLLDFTFSSRKNLRLKSNW